MYLGELVNALFRRVLPAGGSTGQVLKKSTGADYEVEWGTDQSGGGGGGGTPAAGSVDTAQLADGAVTAPKLASDAVTNVKIADDAVDSEQIADAAITSGKLASNAVTRAKIADAAVGSDEIAGNAVNNNHMATDAIDTDAIQDAAVTADKIGSGAVTSAKIANLQVGRAKITALAVDTGQLNAGAVTSAKLATNAVTSAKIAGSAVTQAKIANGAVGGSQIAAGGVGSTELANNAVIAGKISDGAVGTSKLANLAVTLGKLAATVTARLVPAGGNANQVLTRQGASGFGWANAQLQGGGTAQTLSRTDYSSTFAPSKAATAITTGGTVSMDLAAGTIESGHGLTVASNEITVARAGVYHVNLSMDVGYETSPVLGSAGGGRIFSTVELAHTPSGGAEVILNDSLLTAYARQPDNHTGTRVGPDMYHALLAGTFKLGAGDKLAVKVKGDFIQPTDAAVQGSPVTTNIKVVAGESLMRITSSEFALS